jgi:MFS family permease
MAFIDGSVLTVALPKLRAAVGADLASVQWVINSYVFALASLTLIGGALAEAYGKARVLSIGCLLFGATSGGCALVPSLGRLIAARVLQGTAVALVTPASLALIGAGGALTSSSWARSSRRNPCRIAGSMGQRNSANILSPTPRSSFMQSCIETLLSGATREGRISHG